MKYFPTTVNWGCFAWLTCIYERAGYLKSNILNIIDIFFFCGNYYFLYITYTIIPLLPPKIMKCWFIILNSCLCFYEYSSCWGKGIIQGHAYWKKHSILTISDYKWVFPLSANMQDISAILFSLFNSAILCPISYIFNSTLPQTSE